METDGKGTAGADATRPHVAIIGKGALGLLQAEFCVRRLGPDSVEFVMDEGRLARHAHETYRVNGQERAFKTVGPADARPADLAIVAVKSLALEGALPILESVLTPDTPIISLLNGIRSEGVIAKRYGEGRVVGCVAQGMDAMRFGAELTFTKHGRLIVGALPHTSPDMAARAEQVLAAAGIPYEHSDDIVCRMWTKLMLNDGINQTCCAFGSTYGEVLSDRTGEQFRCLVAAMRETRVVAAAEGVDVPEGSLTELAESMGQLAPDGMPSRAQDRIAGRPTELDEFAGEVCRRARAHGILVPTNEWLYQRIREIEKGYARKGDA